jgi:hypothetical protein
MNWLIGPLPGGSLARFMGVRRRHLRRYLDEFVFRWNRRRHTKAAFDTLVCLAVRLPHASMREFVDTKCESPPQSPDTIRVIFNDFSADNISSLR